MIRSILTISALLLTTACGDGSPFNGGVAGGGGAAAGNSSGIPEEIAANQSAFQYDPVNQTLTVTGTFKDGDETTTTFRRRPALDRGNYQAYTAQDDPLDSHATVYVRNVGTVTGVVTVLGTQFGKYRGGSGFSRSGGFSPGPISEAGDTGLVTYAGRYVGLTNLNGERTDMANITVRPARAGEPAIPADPSGTITVAAGGVAYGTIPNQAGVVDGVVLINVALDDPAGNVSGVVTERTVNSYTEGTLNLDDIVLASSDLTTDGTFQGDIQPRGTDADLGEYSGLIGGANAGEIAGSLFAKAHFGTVTRAADGTSVSITGEEEFGIFVLGRCNGPTGDVNPECAVAE